MLEEEYLQVSKELSSLKEQREELEGKLYSLNSREDIIDCKYEILKISEKIPILEKKLIDLSNQLQEKKQVEIEFKESYINLNVHIPLFKRLFNINQLSNDEVIMYVLDNCTREQISMMNKIFKFLNQSEIDNLINEFNNQHPRLSTLLTKYYDKCNSIENFRPSIKNKIKVVEKRWDLKFNGFTKRNDMMVEFIKDFSKEVNFESFLLKNYTKHVFGGIIYSYADTIYSKYEERDVYVDLDDIIRDCEDNWEDIPEYDKLNLINIDGFFDSYLSEVEDEISEVVEGDFKYDVDVKMPIKRNPVSMQTQEYKYKKDGAYKKKVQRYNELIDKKRNESNKKSDNPKCFKKLNEDSSIEDIAACYCECKGFNNWEHDEKNKKIIFKSLRADGKNYTKMKKVEVKELKKWINNYNLI